MVFHGPVRNTWHKSFLSNFLLICFTTSRFLYVTQLRNTVRHVAEALPSNPDLCLSYIILAEEEFCEKRTWPSSWGILQIFWGSSAQVRGRTILGFREVWSSFLWLWQNKIIRFLLREYWKHDQVFFYLVSKHMLENFLKYWNVFHIWFFIFSNFLSVYSFWDFTIKTHKR